MKNSTYHIFFKKLSSPLRIDIISCLDKSPKSVTKLTKELGTEQSKLSHALKELKSCNIVKVKKHGKQRIYSLNETIVPMLRLIDKHSENCSKCKGCNLFK